jgi:hypothetical protein
MTPVNFLNGSLVSYTLSERESSLPKGLVLAQCKWNYTDGRKQKQAKGGSNKVRLSGRRYLLFHN